MSNRRTVEQATSMLLVLFLTTRNSNARQRNVHENVHENVHKNVYENVQANVNANVHVNVLETMCPINLI
jgi:hypothetical protein